MKKFKSVSPWHSGFLSLAHNTYSCLRSIIRLKEETSSEAYTSMSVNYSLIKKDFQTYVEICDKQILFYFRLL